MNKKVLGNIGFASFFAAMLVVGLVERQKPMRPAESSRPTAVLANMIEARDQSASSTISPAFIPHSLPVPDMVDVAAEAALSENSPNEDASQSEDSAEHMDDDSAQVLVRPQVTFLAGIATSRAPEKPAMMGSFVQDKPYDIQALGSRYLSRISARYSLYSHEFNALLQPGGFYRPHWQDLTVDARLTDLVGDSKPFLVMIDPGHGGSDPGSKAHNGLVEKNLTLDIARRVRLFLTEIDDIDVQLTRNHDYGLSRHSRVSAIKRSAADLVISLHFNHLPQSDVNLVESFYAGPENIHESRTGQRNVLKGDLQRTSAFSLQGYPDLSFTEGSERLAHDLQQRVFTEVSFENEHAQNAGVKQETLFVLTQSYTPGVLLEISCLSYPHEADKLTKDEYRNRLAAALVDGIRNYHDSLQVEPLKKPGDLGV